jgi:hypothetical protein
MSRFILHWWAALGLLLVSTALVSVQSCIATGVSKTGDVVWAGDCKLSGVNTEGYLEVDCQDSKELATNSTITTAYIEATLAGDAPATIPCTLFAERVFGRHFVDCTLPPAPTIGQAAE